MARDTSTLRLQFEVSRTKADEIRRLMHEGGFETQKEFFNNAVTLLKWALDHAQKGHAVSAIDRAANREYELQMPFLAHAAPRPERS